VVGWSCRDEVGLKAAGGREGLDNVPGNGLGLGMAKPRGMAVLDRGCEVERDILRVWTGL
jgi:hypothetical protein